MPELRSEPIFREIALSGTAAILELQRKVDSLAAQLLEANDARVMAEADARRLREALACLCRNFPTDSDMTEAGWEGLKIESACMAYDKARVAVASQAKGAL